MKRIIVERKFKMIAKTIFVFVTLFALTLANAPEVTDADFDVRVREADNTLVMFYAPW